MCLPHRLWILLTMSSTVIWRIASLLRTRLSEVVAMRAKGHIAARPLGGWVGSIPTGTLPVLLP